MVKSYFVSSFENLPRDIRKIHEKTFKTLSGLIAYKKGLLQMCFTRDLEIFLIITDLQNIWVFLPLLARITKGYLCIEASHQVSCKSSAVKIFAKFTGAHCMEPFLIRLYQKMASFKCLSLNWLGVFWKMTVHFLLFSKIQ